MRREQAHLCSFVFNFVVLAAVVAVVVVLQGTGYINLHSDKLVTNSLELVALLGVLAFLATYLIVEMFLIGASYLTIAGVG